MNDHEPSRKSRWMQRIADSLSGEPRDIEELLETLIEAKQRNIIENDVFEMLQGVLEVAELQARDIMVPRSQMIVISWDDPIDRILPAVIESGHSRFPVVGENHEKVLGILLAKDLLRVAMEQDPAHFDIKECLRSVMFIPESKRLNVLLKEFRANQNHMAIVVDEYGGVAGLITIEDVLEQIVGDIDDEYDIDEDLDIRREDVRQFTVRAQTRIEVFNEFFGTRLSDAEYDTVGGFVLHHLGRLPRRGETFVVADMEFKVLRCDRRHIELLRVRTEKDILPEAQE